MRTARLGGILAVLALAATLVGTCAPVGATGRVRAVITFEKNHAHPFASRLVWRVDRRQTSGRWKVVQRVSWRAGSGFGGPSTENSCVRGRGWLPDGRYSETEYDHYGGSLIHGRAFYLGNHACADGTMRSELFIHSEETVANGQCPNAPGDQNCRWEWPRINDYRSGGCIKMSPGDIRSLVLHYHQFFRAGVRYAQSDVLVRVVH